MRALIYETADPVGTGMLDVAGRSVLVRQLQWLRDIGIEDVVAEISEGPWAVERGAFLLGTDPLVSRCVVIPSARPLGVEELARRAGLGRDEPFIALPANIVAHAKLDLARVPARYLLDAPLGSHEAPVDIALRTLAVEAEGTPAHIAGWGMRVASEASAHALGCAALEGQAPGLVIHAAEIKPGVWLARGARVAPDAQLHAPVLIGAETRVLARAQVGPRAILGSAVVVERDAVVSESSIAIDTIVGEGTRIRQAHAAAHWMTNLGDGTRTRVDDALVLTSRNAPNTPVSSRALALLIVILLLLPWLLIALVGRLTGKRGMRAISAPRGALHTGDLGIMLFDRVPALFDVIWGRRDLVGISDDKVVEIACARSSESLRPGAFDLSRALAPNASTSTLLRMWRWYRVHKSSELDRKLWRGKGS